MQNIRQSSARVMPLIHNMKILSCSVCTDIVQSVRNSTNNCILARSKETGFIYKASTIFFSSVSCKISIRSAWILGQGRTQWAQVPAEVLHSRHKRWKRRLHFCLLCRGGGGDLQTVQDFKMQQSDGAPPLIFSVIPFQIPVILFNIYTKFLLPRLSNILCVQHTSLTSMILYLMQQKTALYNNTVTFCMSHRVYKSFQQQQI